MPTIKTLIAIAGCHAALIGPQAGAQEPVLARLYAAQAPPGSSFVRAVNATRLPLRVAVGADATAQDLAPEGRVATAYQIVDASRPLALRINGQSAGHPLTLAPNVFVTVVIRADGQRHALQTITDASENHGGLRAELRFYNLAPSCMARLEVVGGPTVFEQVGAGQSRLRAINPVSATLTSQCDAGTGNRLTLPALQADDHYSLFLIGSAAGTILAGQLAQTEAYKGAR